MQKHSENTETDTCDNNVLVAVKLTKKVLNEFISWTTTKYNDYLGYGTKKEAVLTAYNSLLKGYYVQANVYSRDTQFHKKGDVILKENPEVKIVEFQCSGSCGENQRQRLWRTKQGSEQYVVDCINKTITAKKSNRVMKFDLSIQ
ncbi:hypothetical protein [Flavobacterium koreense]